MLNTTNTQTHFIVFRKMMTRYIKNSLELETCFIFFSNKYLLIDIYLKLQFTLQLTTQFTSTRIL